MSSEFYGRGLSFPLRLGIKGLAESAGPQKVEESIRMILRTQYGERMMRPRFGCNLKSLVFSPNNTATANLARYYVEEGLRQWEPRIELVNTSVENDNEQGALLIRITYRLSNTPEIHNLVYPFYLELPE